MIKNILIISSNITGHGHKSITDSLLEQFSNYPDITTTVLDGFSLGGDMGMKVGKMYGSVTRNAKELWRVIWELSAYKPSLVCEFTEFVIKDNFIGILKDVKPDLILSVHPNFNGSVINIMEKYKLNIPFVILIADLVSISPLWTEPRADYIICPTPESKQKSIEFGVDESKTRVMGFPVRSRFCNHIGTSRDNDDYSSDRPLECLIMSGGEGVGNMNKIARILLDNFNCRVKIVAGRNAILKKKLENTLVSEYGSKVEIYGFMDNIQELMLSSDIAFTRGSPNVAMEAVSCSVPLIVTDALPGQEAKNPEYIQENNLGIVCRDLSKLKALVSNLLENNAQKLNQIKQSQKKFRNPDVAKNIVEFVLNLDKSGDVDFEGLPKPTSRLRNFKRITNSNFSILKKSSK